MAPLHSNQHFLPKLPAGFKNLLEIKAERMEFVEDPKQSFAVARTARKEAPEAFAGLHGDYVALWGDEASGVPNEIFRAGEGSLTNKDTLVVLISNPTRLEGYPIVVNPEVDEGTTSFCSTHVNNNPFLCVGDVSSSFIVPIASKIPPSGISICSKIAEVPGFEVSLVNTGVFNKNLLGKIGS